MVEHPEEAQCLHYLLVPQDAATVGLGAMLAAWGVCIFGCPEDLNDDWMVNGTDLGLLLANWS